jgi:hypothetical protein
VAEKTGNPAEDDDDADKKETKKRKRAPAKFRLCILLLHFLHTS